MNQQPSSSMTPSGASRRLHRGIVVALAGLTVLVAAQAWHSHAELSSMRSEVAQRLKNADDLNTETKILLKSVQDSIRDVQAKVSVLENKQLESQSQQVALDQLYQQLSRSRDEWALAEIEQVLSTASQQLQLAGNVQGALIALQNADNRLAGSDAPQFITIRRAIAKDLDKLRSLPNTDLTGNALRLDNIIGQIDTLPLLADEKPAMPVARQTPEHGTQKSKEPKGVGKTAGAKPGSSPGWMAAVADGWRGWTAEMWVEISQLIRVRNVETPEALMLSPTQAYFVRENLKLRLLNARMSLLSHNEATFRSDLASAQEAIARYFDTRVKATQSVQAVLRQMQNSNLSIEMPTLAESLTAVRNYKAKP